MFFPSLVVPVTLVVLGKCSTTEQHPVRVTFDSSKTTSLGGWRTVKPRCHIENVTNILKNKIAEMWRDGLGTSLPNIHEVPGSLWQHTYTCIRTLLHAHTHTHTHTHTMTRVVSGRKGNSKPCANEENVINDQWVMPFSSSDNSH
jgi:hypothetical protein